MIVVLLSRPVPGVAATLTRLDGAAHQSPGDDRRAPPDAQHGRLERARDDIGDRLAAEARPAAGT